jgi:hypothetical protein
MLNVHGFVSQGALLSTANNYLGQSKRGSVEFFEAAVTVSAEVVDRLRAGVQLFTRDLGTIGNYTAHVDWAYLDYAWREWLGVRAGRIKLPFGLYNEYSDIDPARTPILLPQSVYPIRNRDFLLAHTGAAIYGALPLGPVGTLDYNLAYGTMFVDISNQPAVSRLDTRDVVGAQLFWRTPLPGLRLGGTLVRLDMEFSGRLDAQMAAQFAMLGLAPPGFDGRYTAAYKDVNLMMGSMEWASHGWLVAGEYGRWFFDAESTPPALIPNKSENQERFYGMVGYRLLDWLHASVYYSVLFLDANDRSGTGMRFMMQPDRAYQKDLALTLRLDINEHWLFKLEGHYLDGTAELQNADNADPAARKKTWGLFLAKTTLSF